MGKYVLAESHRFQVGCKVLQSGESLIPKVSPDSEEDHQVVVALLPQPFPLRILEMVYYLHDIILAIRLDSQFHHLGSYVCRGADGCFGRLGYFQGILCERFPVKVSGQQAGAKHKEGALRSLNRIRKLRSIGHHFGSLNPSQDIDSVKWHHHSWSSLAIDSWRGVMQII